MGHQWSVQKAEREIDIATSTFERISSLVDQRNYRMRRLIWAIKGRKDIAEVNRRLEIYQNLLFNWNDSLNANFALAQFYFGDDIRANLENNITRGFIDVGFAIECAIQEAKNEESDPRCKSTSVEQAESRLEALGYEIYGFNLDMLKSIKERQDKIETDRFKMF